MVTAKRDHPFETTCESVDSGTTSVGKARPATVRYEVTPVTPGGCLQRIEQLLLFGPMALGHHNHPGLRFAERLIDMG